MYSTSDIPGVLEGTRSGSGSSGCLPYVCLLNSPVLHFVSLLQCLSSPQSPHCLSLSCLCMLLPPSLYFKIKECWGFMPQQLHRMLPLWEFGPGEIGRRFQFDTSCCFVLPSLFFLSGPRIVCFWRYLPALCFVAAGVCRYLTPAVSVTRCQLLSTDAFLPRFYCLVTHFSPYPPARFLCLCVCLSLAFSLSHSVSPLLCLSVSVPRLPRFPSPTASVSCIVRCDQISCSRCRVEKILPSQRHPLRRLCSKCSGYLRRSSSVLYRRLSSLPLAVKTSA